MPTIITSAAEPDGAPRIAVLDILRGIAILGILFMNINDMGGSLWASFDDIRHLGWTPADRVAWWLREIFANGTARCMLEMLFGAGMVILTDRAAEAADEWAVMRRYYVRNIVLFLFGCIHIFILLWPGDILHTYGLAALIAFLFRRLRPRLLITIGLSLAAVQLVGGSYGYYATLDGRAEQVRIEAKRDGGQALSAVETRTLRDRAEHLKKRAKEEAETKADVAAEDEARQASTGTFASWAAAAWGVTIKLERRGFEFAFVWEAAATMLIGAGLFKLGVLQGGLSRGSYRAMIAIAYLVGITCRAIGAYEQTRFGDGPHSFWATAEVARLAMTLGHIGLINVLVMSASGARLLKPFQAAGRTALSLYVMQTLICLWVLFPPFAFGLYGKLSWAPLMAVALAISLALLCAANIWVRHFRIAPVEWAWRSLVERRRLPWR